VEPDDSPWGETGGPVTGGVAAITTIGEAVGGAEDVFEQWVTLVQAARCDAEREPGNLGAGVIAASENADTLTITLWENLDALSTWAYRGDVHRTAIDRTGVDWHFTRSSFTRLRVIRRRGTWIPCCTPEASR
jgi:heme-degrading monooxygenase HmoA